MSKFSGINFLFA